MTTGGEGNGALTNRSVVESVVALRGRFGVPVNVIQADEPLDVPSSVVDLGVHDALDWIQKEASVYRWRPVGGRDLLYPTDPAWDARVPGVQIKDLARYEAAIDYAQVVSQHVPALADLVGPILKGDPRSPVFTEPISLDEEATVVEHLVQLLGDTPSLAFTVERSMSGQRVLHFTTVTTSAGGG